MSTVSTKGPRPVSRATKPAGAAVRTPVAGGAWRARVLNGLPLLLILAAATLVQLHALRAPFFADDYLFLDQVRTRSLIGALTSRDPLGNFARPIGRQLHFWWLMKVSHESPVVFHLANLLLFLIALALLFAIARRVTGARGAAVASAVVALHYAADVPVRWASGSQDLLALAGSLAGIWLFMRGLSWAAVPAFAIAVLSKETALVSPLIAVLAARRHGEPWKTTLLRGWPLLTPIAAWAAVWIATAPTRGDTGAVTLSPAAVPAAMAHLFQVFAGWEWGTSGAPNLLNVAPRVVPLLLVLAAVWVARAARRAKAPRGAGRPAKRPSAAARDADAAATAGGTRGPDARADAPAPLRQALLLGGVWMLVGAAPVAAVVPIWSAYYYLFAVCGAALALGALVARWPGWAAALVVLVLAQGSENGRTLEEFATAKGPWTSLSHVNGFYLDRAMGLVSKYLDQIKEAHPTIPHRSTFFWFGFPAFAGLQTADGPVVRWAYRDTSLRSYFLSAMTVDRVRRGPAFFFVAKMDTLKELPDSPDVYRTLSYSLILGDKFAPARDALHIALARDSTDLRANYWLAWLEWERGDHAVARRLLVKAGMDPVAAPPADLESIARQLAAKDPAASSVALTRLRTNTLNPAIHALIADYWLSRKETETSAGIEAFAARVLTPEDPKSWRRWSSVLVIHQRYQEAHAALKRYFALAGHAADNDVAAKRTMAMLERVGPGGDLAQQNLRETVAR